MRVESIDPNLIDNEAQPFGDGEITVAHVLKDFRRAYEAKRHALEEARQDYEFFLGKQWDDKDVKTLEEIGVRALTINKISTHIQLLKGIESQNRSDFKAFPEGAEDSLPAEIATRLMKHAVKNSGLDFKITEMFEDGNVCGESYLEPWIHYPYKNRKDGTVDLTGNLCWRKNYYDTVYPDPLSREYDLSDARYICKFTSDLTANQLIEMFPAKRKAIEDLADGAGGKINVDNIALDRNASGIEHQTQTYEDSQPAKDLWVEEKGFDLIDYHYKKYVKKFYVADYKLNQVRLAKNEKEAKNYVKAATRRDRPGTKPSAEVIERLKPEMWTAFVVGGMTDDFLAHGPCWTFPNWMSFNIFPYFCFRSSAPIDSKNRPYLIQGITRKLKDLNRELNKRRTQALRHLNQSANSGWIAEEDSQVDPDKWESYSSAPGVNLLVKRGAARWPEKITPTPISSGHEMLAREYQQDMRDAAGVNPETLAIEADQSSGRAIALRQKQGMVMVQGQFDNLHRTKKLIGQFILSVLPELYDVEKALRVLGEAFLMENFSAVVVDPATGQPVRQFNKQAAMDMVNKVLNDSEFGAFDVFVGENISTETIQMTNYLQLMDMVSKGMPVPPDVIVEESTLSESQKKKIISAFQAQQQVSAPAAKPKRSK